MVDERRLVKVTILQSNFAKGLNQVSRVVGNRTTLPVLSNILISAKKGHITLSATDLEIGVTTKIPGKVDKEGDLTVPARLLSDFVLNNSDETIEVTAEETKMKLKSERFEANIGGISAEEFPTIPNTNQESFCSIKKEDFIEALKKVAIAPAHDETRPVLAGIYFQFEAKNLVLAATDSYRLAENRLELEKEAGEKKMIVPTKTVTEVLRLAGGAEGLSEIKLSSTENQVSFIIGETEVVSRVIEGAFPNYSQIIPASSKITAVASRAELVSAVKMASLFAKDAANNIKITVAPKELLISSAMAQAGGASAKVKASVKGEEVSISFNARYILEMLQVVSSDEITLKFNDSASSGLIESAKDKGFIYLVMPLRMEN